MNEKEKDDEEVDQTAVGKETEEVSKKVVQIGRPIEERRNIPKEEKQRLKEVIKCIQRILEDFKCVKNMSGLKSAKKRVLIIKIKNEKGGKKKKHHVSKIDSKLLDRILKKYATTMNKKKLNKKSMRMKMRAVLMCTVTTSMR